MKKYQQYMNNKLLTHTDFIHDRKFYFIVLLHFYRLGDLIFNFENICFNAQTSDL